MSGQPSARSPPLAALGGTPGPAPWPMFSRADRTWSASQELIARGCRRPKRWTWQSARCSRCVERGSWSGVRRCLGDDSRDGLGTSASEFCVMKPHGRLAHPAARFSSRPVALQCSGRLGQEPPKCATRRGDHAAVAPCGGGCERAIDVCASCHSGRSVETELVALDVLHHQARLVLLVGLEEPHACRAEREQTCALGLQCGETFRTDEPGADPYVEMHPVLGNLALGDALEEQPRSLPVGISAGEPCIPILGRLGTVELVPAWRSPPVAAARRTPAPRTRTEQRAQVRHSRR